MDCFIKNQDGFLYSQEVVDLQGCKDINGFILTKASEYNLGLNIDPEQVAIAFSWGFGVVALFWFFGYGVSVAQQSIRNVR